MTLDKALLLKCSSVTKIQLLISHQASQHQANGEEFKSLEYKSHIPENPCSYLPTCSSQMNAFQISREMSLGHPEIPPSLQVPKV